MLGDSIMPIKKKIVHTCDPLTSDEGENKVSWYVMNIMEGIQMANGTLIPKLNIKNQNSEFWVHNSSHY